MLKILGRKQNLKMDATVWSRWKQKLYGVAAGLMVLLGSAPVFAADTITINGAADQNSISQKVNDFFQTPGIGVVVGFFQVIGIVWLGIKLGHKMFKAAQDRNYSHLAVDAIMFIVAAIILIKPQLSIEALIWVAQKFTGSAT